MERACLVAQAPRKLTTPRADGSGPWSDALFLFLILFLLSFPPMRPHLLILDLDETLIFGTETPLDRPPDFRVEWYSVYERPFLEDFLETVAQWYDLAVWSSAGRDYVDGVVAAIFPDRSLLNFIWASERCTQRFCPETWEHYWVKDLKKVKRAGFPLGRTLFLDDTPRKLERQYGNLVTLTPFTGQVDDTELREVLPFLERLSTIENLRTVEKRFWRNRVLEITSHDTTGEPH
jgi:TFIIF-interacting CTD phosphatase-like protein